MNNGWAFSSLDGNPWHDQPQFLPGQWQAKKCWISRDLQTSDLIDKNSNSSRSNMKSQIKSKKNKSVSLRNY